MDEQPERRRVFDEVGGFEMMTELVSFFGIHRALQLIGWAVRWGVQNIENSPEWREELRAQGISQATAYRAATDFRRFKDYVERRVGHPVTSEELMADLTRGPLPVKGNPAPSEN